VFSALPGATAIEHQKLLVQGGGSASAVHVAPRPHPPLSASRISGDGGEAKEDGIVEDNALRAWQKPAPALKRRAYTLLRKTTPTDHDPPHSRHVKFRSNDSLHTIKTSAKQQLLEELSRGALSASHVLKHNRATWVTQRVLTACNSDA
jgi:hypothetical protein